VRRTSWRAISGRPYFAAISAADAASTLPRHAVAVAASKSAAHPCVANPSVRAISSSLSFRQGLYTRSLLSST